MLLWATARACHAGLLLMELDEEVCDFSSPPFLTILVQSHLNSFFMSSLLLFSLFPLSQTHSTRQDAFFALVQIMNMHRLRGTYQPGLPGLTVHLAIAELTTSCPSSSRTSTPNSYGLLSFPPSSSSLLFSILPSNPNPPLSAEQLINAT